MMNNVLSLSLATYLLILSTAIGIKLTKALPIGVYRRVYSAAIGMGVLSHAVFVLGVAGLYYRAIVIALVIIASILVRQEIGYVCRLFSLGRFSLPESALNKVFLISILVVSACGIVLAMVPPHAADTLKYHLAAPKRFIADHQITFIPIMFFNFPQGGGMLYALGMLLFKDTVGLLLNAFMGILGAVALYAFCQKHLDERIGLTASAIFFSLPPISLYPLSGTPDLGLILYTLLAFFTLFEWIENSDNKFLILSGVFCGFALSWKYIGIYSVVAVLCLFAIVIVSERRSMRCILAFGIPLIIAGSPWYLRNLIVTGNPVWPMFYPILGGIDWNITAYQAGVQEIQRVYSPLGKDLKGLILGPWLINWRMKALFSRVGVGPLFLGFLPLVFLIRKRKLHLFILLFALCFYLAWFPFSQYGRFLLPAFALLCIPIAGGFYALCQRAKIVKYAAVIALAVWLALGIGVVIQQTVQFLPVVVGLESRDDFLSRTVWFYKDIQWMNGNLPEDAVVFSDPKMLYYLDRKYIWGRFRDQGSIDYSQLADVEALAARLRELGVTHQFSYGDNRWRVHPLASEDINHYSRLRGQFQEKYCESIYTNPKGYITRSVTLGQVRRVLVEVYEIRWEDKKGNPGGLAQ
jgi:hypothetical protein